MGNAAGDAKELDPDRMRLLKSKLGRLFTWKLPEIKASIGPFKPEVWQRYDNELQEIIEKCREALAKYSEDQVAEILKGPREGGAIAKQWADFLSNDVVYLERRMPSWHAGGFGHPDHAADFGYWAKMPQFKLGELTCLSVGICPTKFSTEKLFELSISRERHKFSDEMKYLILRFELFKRNFDPYERNAATSPEKFIAWVDQFQEDVHQGFLRPLRAFQLKQDMATDAPSVGKPDKREVDTIAQLFTALAIDYLGYQPRQPRSPIPKEIASLAASMGMNVTDETVRKYLRNGEKFIADDWVPPKH